MVTRPLEFVLRRLGTEGRSDRELDARFSTTLHGFSRPSPAHHGHPSNEVQTNHRQSEGTPRIVWEFPQVDSPKVVAVAPAFVELFGIRALTVSRLPLFSWLLNHRSQLANRVPDLSRDGERSAAL
jgi:hypothetical protein